MSEDAFKAAALKSVVAILKEDFGGSSECGEHSSVTLSCVDCQAAIVRNWLEDICELVYEPQNLPLDNADELTNNMPPANRELYEDLRSRDD